MAELSEAVAVGPLVEGALCDEFFFDQGIEVGVQSPMIDFLAIDPFERTLDGKAVARLLG